MIGTMLNTIVNSPGIFAAQHGLVESANVVKTGGDEWENGVQFTPYGCYQINGHEAGCPAPEAGTPQDCEPVTTFMPYVLDLGLDWNALAPGDDPKYLASLHLEAGTSSALEKRMEVGSSPGTNFTLSDGIALGLAVPALAAVGQVENAFIAAADHTGSGGTLYMAPSVAAQAFGILEEENQPYLRTKTLGSRVIIGNFDPGFVYGHVGEVDVYLGDVFVTDTRDEYRANDYVVLAQRLGMAVWNPCASYVQAVSLPGADGGGFEQRTVIDTSGEITTVVTTEYLGTLLRVGGESLLTIPAGLGAGYYVDLIHDIPGTATVTADAGVLLNGVDGASYTVDAGEGASIVSVVDDEFWIVGGVTPV